MTCTLTMGSPSITMTTAHFADLKQSTTTLGPLQPTLSNFSTLQVMSAIPIDKDAFDWLLIPPIKERVVFKWHEMLENIFTGGEVTPRPEDIVLIKKIPDELQEVDFTLPNTEFTKAISGSTKRGINLTNIVAIYFKSPVLANKLLLPEFSHLEHMDSKVLFDRIIPQKVVMSGEVPLVYLLDVICGIRSSGSEGITIHCENVIVFTRSTYERQIDTIRSALVRIKDDQVDQVRAKMKVFISHVAELSSSETRHTPFIEDLKELSSESFRAVLVANSWLNRESVRSAETGHDLIFFVQEEDPDGTPEDLPESAQGGECAPKEKFSVWPDLKSILSNKRKEIALEEFANRAKPVADALLKGYNCALQILNCASLSSEVTNLDLRLPHVALHIPKDLDIQSLMPRSGVISLVASVSLLQQLTLIEENLRTITLSGVLRALHVKAPQKSTVTEVILPPLDRICDLEDTFMCSFWRRCKRQGRQSSLTCYASCVGSPKEHYLLTIHIEIFRLESSLAGEKARDFDTPVELQVFCHSVILDPTFFDMPKPTIKTVYEICLKLSSLQLITFLREQCDAFLDSDVADRLSYNDRHISGLLNSCSMLAKYLDESLQEDHITGDDAILHMSTEAFKYTLMSAGTGHERYRRAFRISDTQPVMALPANIYRGELPNIKRILSAVKTRKMKTVTVAVLGSGINAFHPEFNLRLGQVRGVGRDRNCPFGESIVGLSFNPIPNETTDTFLNHSNQVGTLCAGLIAGKSKGAALFASIISIKVTNSSNFTKPEFVNAGLSWLFEQERSTYLPESDIVFLPMNFQQLSFETHQLLNHMSASGKIVICSSAKSEGSPTPHGRPPWYLHIHVHMGRMAQYSRAVARVSNVASLTKISPVLAAAQAAGVVAYTLAYAEYIGGRNLRRAISNNSVMRELLRQMCSKPAQHDEQSGFGCLIPHHVFQHSSGYFKQMVNVITSEYRPETSHPGSRFRRRLGESLDSDDHDASIRSRSRSFTLPDELVTQQRRRRSHSENID